MSILQSKSFQNPRQILSKYCLGKWNCSTERKFVLFKEISKLIEETRNSVLNDEIRKDLFEKTKNMENNMREIVALFIEDGKKFYFK